MVEQAELEVRVASAVSFPSSRAHFPHPSVSPLRQLLMVWDMDSESAQHLGSPGETSAPRCLWSPHEDNPILL